MSTPVEIALQALHNAEVTLEAVLATEVVTEVVASGPPPGTSLLLGHIGQPPVKGHDY